MTRVAGATFSFGDLTIEEAAPVVAELGFDLVDVGAGWSNYHQILPQEAVDDADGQSDRLRRVLEAHGIAVSELFIMHFGHPINHPDPRTRSWTRSMYDGITTFAQKAGFESVMMIPGHIHEKEGQSPQEAFDLSVEELRFMVDIAAHRQLQCNIEPCIGSIAEQPADAIRLMEAVPGLGLTVDYAHQIQLGLGHEQIEILHPHARHFHAKQSSRESFQARAREGSIDFPRLIKKLDADAYDGVICVEFVTQEPLLAAGWDFKTETARLKQILDNALAEL